jgi:hypothetical protein
MVLFFGESQRPEIPKALRGFAGVLLSDQRVPAAQTTFYAQTSEAALNAAIDHLVNLSGNKGCRHIIEDGIMYEL